MSELVSVIMPVYNSARYLEEAVDSVLCQEYGNLELLIADDGSTDGSAEIIEQYRKSDPRVKVKTFCNNVGAARARNALLETAQGRFIAFLDSDDVWYPWKLDHQVRFMLRKGHGFSYTYYEAMNEFSEHIGAFTKMPLRVGFRDILRWNNIGALTVMVDRRVHEQVIMPEIPKRQDFALWLLLLNKKDTVAHLMPKITARYRFHNQSLSSNKISAAAHHWKVIRTYGSLNTFWATLFFVHYALRGILRHLWIRRGFSSCVQRTCRSGGLDK